MVWGKSTNFLENSYKAKILAYADIGDF